MHEICDMYYPIAQSNYQSSLYQTTTEEAFIILGIVTGSHFTTYKNVAAKFGIFPVSVTMETNDGPGNQGLEDKITLMKVLECHTPALIVILWLTKSTEIFVKENFAEKAVKVYYNQEGSTISFFLGEVCHHEIFI